MLLTSFGYPLRFIQTHPEKYVGCHQKTFIFKFFATKIKSNYIVRAEQHNNDFFAVKFYAKQHRKSERKYNIVVNKGDVANILITCAKVIPSILQKFPLASFGFIGSRTIDIYSGKVENFDNNQRYKLYSHHIPQLIGDKTFLHKAYATASAYALLNRKINDIDLYEQKIKSMLIDHYDNILNIV